jgi:glutamate synthase domain-containing protein 3
MIRIAEIVRFLTSRAYRKNHYENKFVENYFENTGYDWSYAILKAWKGYDKNCKKGEPHVSRAHYEVGPDKGTCIVLQGDEDQELVKYEVRNQIVLKRFGGF